MFDCAYMGNHKQAFMMLDIQARTIYSWKKLIMSWQSAIMTRAFWKITTLAIAWNL